MTNMDNLDETLPSEVRALAIRIFFARQINFLPPIPSDEQIDKAVRNCIKIAKALYSI